MSKLKVILVNAIGIVSTMLAIVVIYLVLWKDAFFRQLSSLVITEFMVITGLTIYTKIFYYKSTENSVRTSEEYKENERIVLTAIDDIITDMHDFDKFIDIENINNYNIFLNSKCRNVTVKNYKLRVKDRLQLLWMKLRRTVPEDVTKYFFVKYLLEMEYKASKLHKLSSSAISSMTTCDLSDDRNFASRAKVNYITFGTAFSLAFCLLIAIMGFASKENVDVGATVTKMVIYICSILFNIVTTIITAIAFTKKDDYEYFRRIAKLIEKYDAYKQAPYTIEKLSFIPEVNDGNNSNIADKKVESK